MTSCPYCANLEAFALLPAEPVTHRFYYEVNHATNSVTRCTSETQKGFGHKMRYPIAAIPDYNIVCKRGK